jgi:hypothetical protein
VRATTRAVLAAAVLTLAACGGTKPPRVSPSEAAVRLEHVFPEAGEPSGQVGRDIRPTFVRNGQELSVRSALVGGGVARRAKSGFWLASGAGRMRAVPAEPGDDANEARVIARGDAALFANAAPGIDLLLHPGPAGMDTFIQFREASAKTFSWRINLPGIERLKRLAKGGVGVLVPSGQAEPRATGRTAPARNDAASRPSISPLSGKLGGAWSPSIGSGRRLVARLSAPLALDGRGRGIPSSIEVERSRLVLTVEPDRSASFPVVGRIDWHPTGELGNGWFAYGVDRPLRRSTYSIEGRRIPGLGCASVEKGELASGKEEVSRQVAARKGGCPSLDERGSP